MLRKLVNLAWFFTFFGFFAALMLSYAFLPERVGIHADYEGIADEFVTRETFFYTGLAAFVVFNIICFFSVRILDSVPATSGFYFHSSSFKESIAGWFGGFAAVVNIFLILATAYIALFNTQGDDQMSEFNYLMYVALLLVVFSLIWLGVIFINRRK